MARYPPRTPSPLLATAVYLGGAVLRQWWPWLIPLAWFSLVAFGLLLLAAAFPARLDQLLSLSEPEINALRQLGLSAGFYAVYFITLEIIFIAGFLVAGIVVFWRKPAAWMPALTSLMLITFAIVGDPNFLQTLLIAEPAWRGPVAFMRGLASGCALLFWYLFPNGRFVPWWAWLFMLLWVIWVALWFFWPDLDPYTYVGNTQAPAPPVSFLLVVGFSATGLLAQLYRYRRVSNLAERQQTKWAAFGIMVAAVAYFAFFFPLALLPWLRQPGPAQMLYSFVGLPLLVICLLLAPLSIAVAIFRYRLWAINPVINRTLVYGALTAVVIALYVVVVGTLGALFQARGNFLISLLATGLIAILFQPLREWLQRGVNRLMFGQRQEPLAVLARLGRRLEASLAPEAVLPTIVQTVARSLRSPYVAIALKDGPAFKTAAESGVAVSEPIELPLVYQSETIGRLTVTPPAPDEPFTPADTALLATIAHQASTAVYVARLTADLQQARQQLIAAREEERRRLRRDLHDGLGPALASQGLRLAAMQQLLQRNPAAAEALLEKLLTENEATVANIRRLVYQLRPPALDELGLAAAIRDRFVGVGDGLALPASLRVTVEEPDGGLPPLPAAVEVAAYHIILEAVTNVVRHAQATHCLVRFDLVTNGRYVERFPKSFDQALCLTIQDNGVGLPEQVRAGIGLVSMRERAEEIGGTWTIEPAAGGGTQVTTQLPVEAR